jgi:hypothetical protein
MKRIWGMNKQVNKYKIPPSEYIMGLKKKLHFTENED